MSTDEVDGSTTRSITTLSLLPVDDEPEDWFCVGYSIMTPITEEDQELNGKPKKQKDEESDDEDEQDLKVNQSTKENIPLQPKKGSTLNKKTVEICNCDYECIHNIAAEGETEKLEKALNDMKGETVTVFNLLDKNKRTVLHCASDFKGCPSLANACGHVIMNYAVGRLKRSSKQSFAPTTAEGRKIYNFINAKDKDDYTALYLAAKHQNEELCYLLLSRNADWDIKSSRGKSPAEKIFKKIPKLIPRLIKELVPQQSEYEDGKRTRVSLDFGPLITFPSPEDRKTNRKGIYEELDFLSNICYTPLDERLNILKLPAVKTLIWLKWRKIKWFVIAARFFQVAWFLLYSIFLILVYRHDCPYKTDVQFRFYYWFSFEPPITNNSMNPNSDAMGFCLSGVGTALVWILLTTLTINLILIDLPPIRVRLRRYWHPMKSKNPRKYFKRFLLAIRVTHAGKLIFLLLIFATLFPIAVQNFADVKLSAGWYIIASLGVGMAWFNILNQIGKIPKFKVYIKMLNKVLQTLGVIMMIYGSMIIAFAMVFCILLPGVGAFSSPLEALMKMFTFFIGELNYDETVYGADGDNLGKSVSVSLEGTMIVFGIAIVILNIALLNFVIGLTVADIQDLKKYTETWEAYSLLWQIFLFDTFLSHFPIRSLGHKLLIRNMIFKPEVYQSNTPDFKISIQLDKLPKKLRKEIQEMNLKVAGSKKTETGRDSTFVCVRKSHSKDLDDYIV